MVLLNDLRSHSGISALRCCAAVPTPAAARGAPPLSAAGWVKERRVQS